MPDFLQWIRDPDNEEEVLTLAYTAQENRKSPSHYAFGDVPIPTQSEYEIDFYVTAIRIQDQARKAEQALLDAKNRRS
ncbi:MAG: hypothetical protein OXL96_13800 [Candidatus Poribacteria bacterium]|nr:hypothetical protein [Candidatus Poribacteria bacterium]